VFVHLGIILRISSVSGFLKNKVMATRDVAFDESRKYHPDNLTFELSERVEEPLQTIEFPDHSELARGVESDEEESETQSVADSVNSDQSSTIQVIPRNNSAQKTVSYLPPETHQFRLHLPERRSSHRHRRIRKRLLKRTPSQ
jgi:hypothetical protein